MRVSSLWSYLLASHEDIDRLFLTKPKSKTKARLPHGRKVHRDVRMSLAAKLGAPSPQTTAKRGGGVGLALFLQKKRSPFPTNQRKGKLPFLQKKGTPFPTNSNLWCEQRRGFACWSCLQPFRRRPPTARRVSPGGRFAEALLRLSHSLGSSDFSHSFGLDHFERTERSDLVWPIRK